MKLATILIAAAMLVLLLSVAFAPAQNAPPREAAPIVCTEQYAPVCGRVGNVTRTFSNACYARAAGAAIVASGPCGTAARPLGLRSSFWKPREKADADCVAHMSDMRVGVPGIAEFIIGPRLARTRWLTRATSLTAIALARFDDIIGGMIICPEIDRHDIRKQDSRCGR
jgi:hypothetical protein